jgi:hypothetical protein|tara:strand:+ start:43 stop:489 length:447 start_codon:yes stop_codon:yes gene_type:complete
MNRLLVTLGLLAPLALSACSNFAAEWDRRLHTRALDGFDGCWKGQWRSETSGHDGHLRAIVTRSGDSDYSIRYYALYGPKALPIPFEYTLDSVKVEREGDVFKVVGTIDMGLFGKYSYDGKCSGESYKSSYISEYDRGIFDLERTAAD